MKRTLCAFAVVALLSTAAWAQVIPTADLQRDQWSFEGIVGIGPYTALGTTDFGLDIGVGAEYAFEQQWGAAALVNVAFDLGSPNVTLLDFTVDGVYQFLKKEGGKASCSVFSGLGIEYISVSGGAGNKTDFVIRIGIQGNITINSDWSLEPFAMAQFVFGDRPLGANTAIELTLGAKAPFVLSPDMKLAPGLWFTAGNGTDAVWFGASFLFQTPPSQAVAAAPPPKK